MHANKKQYEINDYAEEHIHHKARQLVGTAGFTEDDVEDLEQEMRLDLWERLAKFDPDKATYNTFVSRLVERKISNLIRHRKQGKRDYRCEEGSIHDDFEFGGDDETAVRVDAITQDEQDFRLGKHIRSEQERRDLQSDVSRAISTLPSDLRQLAELLQSHSSISEVARELGLSRSTVYDRLKRLREAFEESGIHDELY